MNTRIKVIGFIMFCFALAGPWGYAASEPATDQAPVKRLPPGYEIVYEPKLQPDMTQERARKALAVEVYAHVPNADDSSSRTPVLVRNWRLAQNKMVITRRPGADGRETVFTLYHYQLLIPDIAVGFDKDGGRGRYVIMFPGNLTLRFPSLSKAQEAADAFFFFQQRLREWTKKMDEALALFEPKAAEYRAMQVKPAMSEEQRKLIVQANAFTQEKQYEKAIELYQKAIRVGPISYPAAYHNLALLLAQNRSINGAIFNMKRYLLLVPAGKDARSARDKIYEWERMIGK